MFIIFYSFAAFKFLPEKQMQAMNEYSILNILKTVPKNGILHKKEKEKKLMKKRTKVFLLLLTAVIIIAAVTAGGLFISQKRHSSSSGETLGKAVTEFRTKENGTRIENINYGEYLKIPMPKKYIKAQGLSESDSAEVTSRKLQEQIDFLSQDGGGVLVVPDGEYKITVLTLKSGVKLFLSEGTVLTAKNYKEYQSEDEIPGQIIYADGQSDIAILGGGTIDGNGVSFTNDPKEEQPLYALRTFNLYKRVIEARKRIRTAKTSSRPNLIRIENCSNVSIDGLRLKDSANWTFVLKNCTDVKVRNLVIDNHLHIANADGIDITGGSNYTIDHCFIATADDAIVLKPFDGEIKNVTVTDCTVTSFANCFKIGTETRYDVSDISVKNCKFFMPDGIVGGYSAIAIESADGSNIKNVTVEDIEADGVSSVFLVWLGNRLKYGDEDIGSIEGVTIKNINATNIELPSAITGCKEKNIGKVTVENVKSAYRDTEENLDIRRTTSEASLSDYPEITRVSHRYTFSHGLSRYWSLPCYGIYTRYADNPAFKNNACTPRSNKSVPDMQENCFEKIVIG